MIHRDFTVNGLSVRAEYDPESIRGVLLPLLSQLTQLQKALDRRMIVLMAGPPAMGKSTLCCFLEALSRETEGITPVQCVGLDGFHYSNAYLSAHTAIVDGAEVSLRSIKGAPETFDVAALSALLNQRSPVFPIYDRTIHESVPNRVPITEDILIIEGNWLLLDMPGWNTLPRDHSIFLFPEDIELLLRRALARKIAGGFDPEAARAFVQRSDRRNIEFCLEHSCHADTRILIRATGHMEVLL